MRSLRIKKVASVAAGAAMILGAVAPGFAVKYVTPQEQVKSFLEQARQNITDVQVVVGSKAAVADGVAAARIAAELANLAYVKAGEDQTIVPTYTGGTVTNKAVKVEVTGSTTGYEPTETTEYKFWSSSAGADFNAEASSQTSSNIEVTPEILPDVLSEKIIKYKDNSTGNTKEVKYRELVKIVTPDVVYEEDDDSHGLYVELDRGDIQYILDFTANGNGLPTDKSVYKDQEAPEIDILGHKYLIDLDELEDGNFVLYSGEDYTFTNSAEYQTDDGYTVKVQVIEPTVNELAVEVTVTDPNGNTEGPETLEKGDGEDFFDGKVSVYVKSVAYDRINNQYRATVRIGAGKIEFNEDELFPFDDSWYVKDVQFSSGNDYLQKIIIAYGNPDAEDYFAQGDFSNAPDEALKQGEIIYGPKNADGNSLFYFDLAGLGKSSSVDLTEVEISGYNDDEDAVLRVKWVDRDGKENYLNLNKAEEFTYYSDTTASAVGSISAGTYFTVQQGGAGNTEDPVLYKVYKVDDNTAKLIGSDGTSISITTCTDVSSVFGGSIKATWDNANSEIDFYTTTTNPCDTAATVNIYDPVKLDSDTPYTVIEDESDNVAKVVEYKKIEKDNDEYTPVFEIAGEEVEGTTITGTDTFSKFQVYSPAIGNYITCYVGIDYTNRAVYLGGCDLVPDAVGVGIYSKFDNTPITMDLTHVATESDDDGTLEAGETAPYVTISGGNLNTDITVVYDASGDYGVKTDLTYNTNANGAKTDEEGTGIAVYYDIDNSASKFKELADQTIDDKDEDQYKYHITGESIEVEASGKDVTLTIPEEKRDAVLEITGVAPATENETEAETGIQTVSEGATVGGVKINEIVCEVAPVEVQNVTCPAAQQVVQINANNFVVYDKDATATYKIVVGSPLVNSLAAGFGEDILSQLQGAEGSSIIAVKGNNLLVAGFTGEDTLAAAQELVNLLEQLRA